MINESLCNDNSGGKKKAATANVSGEGTGSPTKKPKQKRPKIISPSRQKYETNFESYYISKHLEKKLEEQKAQEVTSSESEGEQKTLITETPFDVITKTTGSINKKVIDRERKSIERASRKLLKKKANKQRNLTELEEEVERLLMKEALVMVTQDFVDRMRTHFNVVYEEEQNEKHH